MNAIGKVGEPARHKISQRIFNLLMRSEHGLQPHFLQALKGALAHAAGDQHLTFLDRLKNGLMPAILMSAMLMALTM